MFSAINSVNAVVENDNDIPEWKKILILKKRAGNGCLLDDLAQHNSVSGVNFGNCDDSVNNTLPKVTGQDFSDISPPKQVTIGKINVQLRSLKSLDNHCNQSNTEFNARDEKKVDNDCQDLEYGPGIVVRLRTKFLNMGAKRHYEPVVRRFSSLENLPGSNAGPYRVNARCLRQNVFKYGARSQYSGNVKKAQSMETLVFSPEQPMLVFGRKTGSRAAGGTVKGKILKSACPTLTDENEEPLEKSPSPRRCEGKRVVLTPNINEDELPKPDTVKHVKKMFELPPQKSLTNHCRFRKSSSMLSSPTSNGPILENRPQVKTVDLTDAKASANELLDLSSPIDERTPFCEKVKFDCEIKRGEIGKQGSDGSLSANRSCDTSLSSDISPSSHLRVSASEREAEEQTVVNDLSPEVTLGSSTPEANKQSPLLHEGSKGSEVEDEEQPVVGGRVDQEGMVVSADSSITASKTAWQKAPQSTTSIVFDFRGTDVKPNISLKPAPFGCRPAKVPPNSALEKRLWSSSFVINGVDNETVDKCYRNADEEDWNEMDIGADLPLISGIVFSGENVIVGRGALLEKRNKKLNLQFDDGATSTFEYPPENEIPSTEELEIPNDCSLNFKKALNSGSNLRSGLSSYTPQVLSSEDFKLGISQSNHRLNLTTENTLTHSIPVSDVTISVSPENTGGWSSSETADILF